MVYISHVKMGVERVCGHVNVQDCQLKGCMYIHPLDVRHQQEKLSIRIANFVEERCNEWAALENQWVDVYSYFENLIMEADKKTFSDMVTTNGSHVARKIVTRLGVVNTITLIQLLAEQITMHASKFSDKQVAVIFEFGSHLLKEQLRRMHGN